MIAAILKDGGAAREPVAVALYDPKSDVRERMGEASPKCLPMIATENAPRASAAACRAADPTAGRAP
jgi:hypothetical protein